MLSYNQLLIRKAASLARSAGFRVIVSDSYSTESSYLYIGQPSKYGGFTTFAQLRVSNHCMPGRRCGGWIKKANQSKTVIKFDLRPRSRSYDRERVDNFIEIVKSVFRPESKEHEN